MSQQTELDDIVRYWFEKADESLDADRDEMKAGRLSFSVNRIYYACFYSASAVLLLMRLRFRKHSGVRASFHQHLVKHGLVSLEHGKLYDELFEARQRGDYIELVTFELRQVAEWLNQAGDFVETMRQLTRTR